jgi:hypothetical protein
MRPWSDLRAGTVRSGAYVKGGGLRFCLALTTGTWDGVEERVRVVVGALFGSLAGAVVFVVFAGGAGSLPYECFGAGRADVDA